MSMRDVEVFSQAIDIPDEQERRAFLALACGDDSDLRTQVDRLLAAHLRLDTMLENPPVAANVALLLQDAADLSASTREYSGTDPLADLPPDSIIGPYRLREKIGEGGFGCVYVAEQLEPVQRHVALKIIKPGMSSKEVVARFYAERQALALMDHPNIAKVHDGGITPSGLPYFVMELVRGAPITEYCNRMHLDVTGRLKLFVDVCKAIQHAHQKGVIHRDIKPQNILVTSHDGVPVVKVIDFGVAKALNQRLTDMTVYTRFSVLIGTPVYMSPEQAELSNLDIDTRCDIYSLGVLLYEMITGNPPFPHGRFVNATIDQLRDIIRHEEPLRPTQVLSALGIDSERIARQLGITAATQLPKVIRSDMDWIVLKALAKDRTQRYDTAIGLSRDIERYLSGEPILARPPTLRYLSSRFMARHRRLVYAAALIAATLVIATLVSLGFAVWAMRERAESLRLEQIALRNEQVADARSKDATSAARQAAASEERAVNSLIAARIAFAKENVWSRQPGQQHESLAAINSAAVLARQTNTIDQHLVDLRSVAISALTRCDVRLSHQLPLSEGYPSWTTAISKDMQTFAISLRDDQNVSSVSVRATARPDVEICRIPVPWDTRADYHDELVLVLSDDGQYILVTTAEGTEAIVWDVIKQTQVLAITGWYLTMSLFHPDSQSLFAIQYASGTNQVRVHRYDLPSGQVRQVYDSRATGALRLSYGGEHLAVSSDTYLSVFNTASGAIVTRIAASGPSHHLAWSRSSQFLASTHGREILVWSISACAERYKSLRVKPPMIKKGVAQDGAPVLDGIVPYHVLSGHEGYVVWLDFHPQQEHLLASGSWDRTARIWNAFSGQQELILTGRNPVFSLDGDQFALATPNGLTTHHLVTAVAGNSICPAGERTSSFAPDTRLMFVSSLRDQLRCWSLAGSRPMVVPEALDATVVAWRTQSNSLLLASDLGLFEFPCSLQQKATHFGPGRQLLACESGEYVSLSLSLNGDFALLFPSNKWSPLLLHIPTGEATTLHRSERVQSCGISPDGRWIALGIRNRIEVIETSTQNILAEFACGSRPSAEFSSDGQWLAANDFHSCQIISTANWTVHRRISNTSQSHQPRFSGDGELLVVPLPSRALGLFRVADGELVAQLLHADAPQIYSHVTLSNNDNWLVHAGENGTATLWDVGQVREELSRFGLDWEGSDPSSHKQVDVTATDRVEFDLGDYAKLREIAQIAQKRSPAEAYEELLKREQQGEKYPNLYAALAQTAEKLRRYQDAVNHWEHACAGLPSAEDWRVQWAQSLDRVDDTAGALRCWQELSAPAKYKAAPAAFVHACRLASTHAELITDSDWLAQMDQWLATLQGSHDEPKLAALLAGLSTESRRDLTEALGLAYFGLGQDAIAFSLLEEDPPETMGSAFALATLYARKGNQTEARRQYALGLARREDLISKKRSERETFFYDRFEQLAARELETLDASVDMP